MKNGKLTALLMTALLAASVSAPAQLNPFVDTATMDTMNSGSVGDASAFGGAIGRAQGAVDATQANAANPFGDPAAGAANPFGDPAAAGAGNPFGGGAAGAFGAPSPFGGAPSPFGAPSAVPGFAPVAEASLTAWGGVRIRCVRTDQVLQDGRVINILVSQVGSYYDDGKTGGDFVAGDNIYTNIITQRNQVSPEAGLIRTRLVQTLQYAASLTPMRFGLVQAATTEPLSPLPKVVELEAEQDEALRQWVTLYLRDFRSTPDDVASAFHPTYMPEPPRAPNIPLPASFTLTPLPEGSESVAGGAAAAQGGGGGEFADDGVTGEPVGNASSRYF